MKKMYYQVASMSPFLIIGGLLYAGLFIKAEPRPPVVADSIFERGDKFFGAESLQRGGYWIVGAGGKVIRKDSSEDPYLKQPIGTSKNLQDIAKWDDSHAIVIGDGPLIKVTQDGGKHWADVAFPKGPIVSKFIKVKTISGGDAWIVGEGGTVLKCAQYGSKCDKAGRDEDISWNDIFVSQKEKILVGEFGNIRYADEKEAEWHVVNSPTKISLMGIDFSDEHNGVAVGLNGTLLTTRDGGKTWGMQKSPTKEHLFAITWDGQRYVVVGEKGVILTGAGNGESWALRKVNEDNQAWYTKILSTDRQYLFVGSKISPVEKSDL